MLNTHKLEGLSLKNMESAITAIVKAKDSNQESWKLNADIISVSRNGAGFYIEKKCHVGQLVSMLLAMPRQLRSYDHDKEFYRVWGLVQFSNPQAGDARERYHVGVAFVGKNAPSSYYANPLQSYRIAGMTAEGLWSVVEAGNTFVHRKHFRHWVSLEVSVSGADQNGEPLTDEKALTENISQSGASVITGLSAAIGDEVKFNCPAHGFSTQAVVRNMQLTEDEKKKMHLEFIDKAFPVRELLTGTAKPAAE